MSKIIRWPDLSVYGIYLAFTNIKDIGEKLIFIDMQNRGSIESLAEANIIPVNWSPKHLQGIYYLDTDERKFTPSKIAKAFGIHSGCPMTQKDNVQIIEELNKAYKEKVNINYRLFVKESIFIGKNHLDQPVHEYNSKRCVQTESDFILENQSAEKSVFLKAINESGTVDINFLKKCLLVKAKAIMSGIPVKFSELKDFGEIIFQKKELSDMDIYLLQENLESVLFECFSVLEDFDDESLFNVAKKAYAAQPARTIRTNDTMLLGQYSTPIPMSFVVQYIMSAAIGKTDEKKTLLEPCIGNSSLISLLCNNDMLKIKGFEIDEKRLNLFKSNIDVKIEDSSKIDFTKYNSEETYDYIITNPPFARIDKTTILPNNINVQVQRLDYLIALRALAARKDAGYSVFILSADGPFSKGEIIQGSKYFYNYIFDNYVVDGLVELSSRLYEKNGANINVRILAIGNKLEPNETNSEISVPNKIQVINTYDELMDWAKHVVNLINNPVIQYDQIPLEEEKMNFEEQNLSLDDEEIKFNIFDEESYKQNLIEEEVKESELTNSDKEHKENDYKSDSNSKSSSEEAYQGDLFSFDNTIDTTSEDLNSDKAESNSSLIPKKVENDIKLKEQYSENKNNQLNVYKFKQKIDERKKNDLQIPYNPGSKLSEATTMIPINLASGTYSALNKIQQIYPDIDEFVRKKLEFSSKEELAKYFSAEQIDALALAIFNYEQYSRSSLNADQTGIGKGRFVAGLMRYARLNGMVPVFITYKASLMADIFRDIRDIDSADIFKNVFVINNTPIDDVFDPTKSLFKSMPLSRHKKIIETGILPENTDIILGTYSQFNKELSKSKKTQFLLNIQSYQPFYFLDESHNAAGESQTYENLALALEHSSGASFSSATALKTASSFKLYQSLFPSSINTKSLTPILQAGGESLQEAVSICLAQDGVLIRREHDLSKLEFRVVHSTDEEEERNKQISDQVANILSMMSTLSGDISLHTKNLNKEFREAYNNTPEEVRKSGEGRMQASSLNFGSRLYNITRQFLLGLQIEQTVRQAIDDLNKNIKPVIAVENTGESFVHQLIDTLAFNDYEYLEYDMLSRTPKTRLNNEENEKLQELEKIKEQRLKGLVLDAQFKDYLSIMTKKLRRIVVTNRYGNKEISILNDDSYIETEKVILNEIEKLPNTIPLIPLDYIRHSLNQAGYSVGEVSGRNIYLKAKEVKDSDSNNKLVWYPKQANEKNVTKTINEFQNGDLDAIIITKAGSTGYSMHASPRFKDTRQRDFIALQKASNIAEYLQWIGRVNRKDQVIEPIITNLTVGLPAELRLIMMHNEKLRKLSANITSNRENNNIENKSLDFLNTVGNDIACIYLVNNPSIAEALNISVSTDTIEQNFKSPTYYINNLMSKIILFDVEKQNKIINDLSNMFTEKIDELEAQNINPFSIKIHDWKARVVDSHIYNSFDGDNNDSSFDEAIVLDELEFDINKTALKFDSIQKMVDDYLKDFENGSEFDHLLSKENNHSNRYIKLTNFATEINQKLLERCFKNLPLKIRDKVESSSNIQNFIDDWQEDKNFDKYILMYNLAESALKFSDYNVGSYINVLNDLNEIKVGRIVGYLLPEKKIDITHGGRLGLKVIIAGDNKATTFNMIKLNHIQKELENKKLDFILGKENGQNNFETQINQALNTKLLKRVRVLRNNMYKATELALENKMGYPILFTNTDGVRQRAILLNNNFTFDNLKNLPMRMNAENMMKYHKKFFHSTYETTDNFQNSYPMFASRMTKESQIELDIALTASDENSYLFIINDPKSHHAKILRSDKEIFDSIGDENDTSLGLKLAGHFDYMSCTISADKVPDLLQLLDKNHGISSLYLMNAKNEILESFQNEDLNEYSMLN